MRAKLDQARRSIGVAGDRFESLFDAFVDAQPGYSPGRGFDDDSGGGHATRIDPWCEVHSQAVVICRMGGGGCGGKAMPAISDPTGEAATSRNEAMLDAGAFRESLRLVAHHSARLEAIAVKYATVDPAALRALTNADPDECCESCWRLKHYAVVFRFSTVNGNLPDRKRLCRWCYDHVKGTGELPPRHLVAQYHDPKRRAGERVRGTAS
jgi:hypothetical protein